MNFSEAVFYENYLTLGFHTNTVISDVFAYPSKWRRNRDKAYCVNGINYFQPACNENLQIQLSRFFFGLSNTLTRLTDLKESL